MTTALRLYLDSLANINKQAEGRSLTTMTPVLEAYHSHDSSNPQAKKQIRIGISDPAIPTLWCSIARVEMTIDQAMGLVRDLLDALQEAEPLNRRIKAASDAADRVVDDQGLVL